MRTVWIGAALVSGLAGAATGAVAYAESVMFPSGKTLEGMYVGGRLQPNDQSLGEWLETRRAALESAPAYVNIGTDMVETTLADLGVEVDVAKTMQAALAQGTEGGPSKRLHRWMQAQRGDLDVPFEWSFDKNRAEVTLKELAPQVRRAPVNARLDLVAHQRIDDQPGEELDVWATSVLIENGERGALPVFEIATRPIPAEVTSSMLIDVDVTKVLAAFETKFKGTKRGRGRNVAKAAEYLNETVVAPGQVISFNDLVGPRELDRGFHWAPVIIRDELAPGVGGGTCQVASTLHAAAVYGLLDIVERRSHSRPSDYAPLGLDAVVIYGEVDLKLRNNYDTPLIIHAFLPDPKTLRVELLGRDPPGEIEYGYAVRKVEDFYRRVTLKPWLDDRRVKRQRGRKGLDIISVVKVVQPDGKRRVTSQYYSGYKPVPEVFWVGPEHDIEELPELPEGADGVEYENIDPQSSLPSDDS